MRGGVFLKNDLNVKLISMEDIMAAKCCDIQEVIRVIEEVLVDYKNGGVMLPDKISQIFNLETQDRINCMPSTLMKDGVCGVKWVSVFPENPHKFSSQNVSGVIILSELEQGFPIAVMDGTLITALRTACMGAIGAKYLARQDSHIYGTIGSGEQAKAHFVAIKQMFPQIDTCYVASRSGKGENQFIAIMKKKYPDVESNYAYFPVVFDGYKYTRNEIFEMLSEQGITARKYFYPLTNSFECYRNYPTAGTEKTPVAQHLALRVLTLPLYADLSLEDVDRICDVILGQKD